MAALRFRSLHALVARVRSLTPVPAGRRHGHAPLGGHCAGPASNSTRARPTNPSAWARRSARRARRSNSSACLREAHADTEADGDAEGAPGADRPSDATASATTPAGTDWERGSADAHACRTYAGGVPSRRRGASVEERLDLPCRSRSARAAAGHPHAGPAPLRSVGGPPCRSQARGTTHAPCSIAAADRPTPDSGDRHPLQRVAGVISPRRPASPVAGLGRSAAPPRPRAHRRARSPEPREWRSAVRAHRRAIRARPAHAGPAR